jgi:hypothetical protein
MAANYKSPEADSRRWQKHCPELYVEFPVTRLENAEVLWINERFFLERKVDVADPGTLREVRRQLLDLAYTTAQGDADAADGGKRIYADRYGGTKIGAHGGSGRCGIIDGFQIKGVGVTPLVGEEYQVAGVMGRPQRTRPPFHRFHSDGAVTLEEAIREAIYAEVACMEMPHGATPIVAILGTGTRMPWGEPCAILVRPNFFRAAYVERAVRYRPLQSGRNVHAADAKRVREIVAVLDDKRSREEFSVDVDTIAEYVSRVSEQMAFAHVHRLSFGPYLSNNLTLNGNVLDFGAARAVENWKRGIVVDMACAFGKDELAEFLDSCTNMLFYIRKYAASSSFGTLPLRLNFLVSSTYEKALDTFLAGLFGLQFDAKSPEVVTISGALKKYFFSQQKEVVNYLSDDVPDSGAWLYDVLKARLDGSPGALDDRETRVIEEIEAALARLYASHPAPQAAVQAKLRAALRMLRPRDRLFRDPLQLRIYDDLLMKEGNPTSGPEFASQIDEFIRSHVATSRRVFDLPDDLVALGAAGNSYSTAIHCHELDRETGEKKELLLLVGAMCGADALFFGRRIPLARLAGTVTKDTVVVRHYLPPGYRGEAVEVEIAGVALPVPRMDILF